MPLVFVHGVRVRDEGDYQQRVAERDELFRRVTLADAEKPYTGLVRDPYWGDFGVKFRWNQASVPEGEYAALGAGDPLAARLLLESPPPEGATPDTILAQTALRSLPQAVDLLWALTSDDVPAGADRARLGDFARRAADYALDYEKRKATPGWLRGDLGNDKFVEHLLDDVDSWALRTPTARVRGSGDVTPPPAGGPTSPQAAPSPTKPGTQPSTPPAETRPAAEFRSLGLGSLLNKLLTGADRVKEAVKGWISQKATQAWEGATHWVSEKAVSLTRSTLHPILATFVGDVLVYVSDRGPENAPGNIIKTVLADVRDAAAQRSDDDPLILVGHSLGGIILYDLLTAYLPAAAPNFRADVLVTVGSQVPLFEEMKEFRKRDDTITGANGKRMPRPATVGRWINIFDRTDILSFAAGKVFQDVEDYAFDSGTDVFSSHSAYFLRPSFYHRLRARLAEGGPS